MSAVPCQALLKDGSPCPNPGRHQHVTQTGASIMVCGRHLRVLHKRERLGSDEEALIAWGVKPMPTPSPGQTTPLIDPSPPMPVDG